ncbi:MAG TPA: ABC transporter permease, partial [Solirubrobacterales bacterium]|nr:ABC transporter permease [Solirubrobacterales bacterium]
MKSRIGPYLQSAPAMLWLALFFIVPLLAIVSISLMTGNSIDGYTLTWNFSVFPDALDQYSAQLGRSFLYGGISTLLALIAMYPVAYWIAFHGG